MATDICLPFLKYSHATGVRSDGSISWTHLTASNLFIVLKGVTTTVVDGQLTMRIVHGNKVLESIDVSRYVDSTIETRRKLEQAAMGVQVDSLPIFGITKESVLAIRYHLNDGQARRLQFRMQNADECRQVAGVLQRRGMGFQEQKPLTTRPNTGMSTLTVSENRPSTVQLGSTYFGPHPSFVRPSLSEQSQILGASGLPQQLYSPSKSPTREFLKAGTLPHDMPPPSLIGQGEVLPSNGAESTRPVSSQMYRSYTTPTHTPQFYPIAPSSSNLEASAGISSSVLSTTNLEATHETTREHDGSLRHSSNLHPRFSEIASAKNPQIVQEVTSNLALSSSDLGEPRMGTSHLSTPAASRLPETFEPEIPPRRELPFQRPSESRCSSAQSRARLDSSALDLPPLPKPRWKKDTENSLPPNNNNLSSRRCTPLKRSFDASRDGISNTSPTKGADSQSSLPQPSATVPSLSNQLGNQQRPSEKAGPMDSLLYGRKPLAERSTNAKTRRFDSNEDAPHELVSPPASSASPPKPISYSGSAPGARQIRTSPNRDSEQNVLQDYTAQSLGDRQAALDDFMVANLENPAFATLCEDVENCWRRIALGL